MLFKRTTIALALAAALLAVAPAAPAAAPSPPGAPPVSGVSATPVTSDGPAWGVFFSSKVFKYYRYDALDSLLFGMTTATVCTVGPILLASGPAGAVVWGLSCSYAAVG